MFPKYEAGPYKATHLPHWKYLGGTSMTMDETSQTVAIPDRAHILEIRAEGGAVYFALNFAFAAANSPGYIPDGGGEIIGPLSNLNSLEVFGSAAVVAHRMYCREAYPQP